MRAFSYDGAGNVTADTRGSTTYNYRYNKRGRLDELSIGSTVTADDTYDGLERLAIRTTQNMTMTGTTHYLSFPKMAFGHSSRPRCVQRSERVLKEAGASNAENRETRRTRAAIAFEFIVYIARWPNKMRVVLTLIGCLSASAEC